MVWYLFFPLTYRWKVLPIGAVRVVRCIPCLCILLAAILTLLSFFYQLESHLHILGICDWYWMLLSVFFLYILFNWKYRSCELFIRYLFTIGVSFFDPIEFWTQKLFFSVHLLSKNLFQGRNSWWELISKYYWDWDI